jgi:Ca2+-binding RTX toxin-like protein
MPTGVLDGDGTPIDRTRVKRLPTVAALLLALGVAAPPADAAISSASIDGTTATLNLDGADDNETVRVSGALLVHSGVGGGLESTSDWDSSTPEEQTMPADGTVDVVINGGDGNDTLMVFAGRSAVARATLNGQAGDDFLAGAESDDTLTGGDGSDTLVGRQGTDVMSGGAGDDTFVWNNGDGSDRLNGDAGVDSAEVNGSAALGDTLTLDPVPGGVRFQRTNLVPFKIDASAERFQVNGLGGNDAVSASDGVSALTLLAVDGGDDADTISGSDGRDLILGGDGNDVLTGGGGRDTIDAGAGDDQVNVRDDTADMASGSDGNDTVLADAANLDVLDGFETVERPPVVPPPPVVTPPPAVTPQPLLLAPPNISAPRPVAIRSGTAKVSNDRASIKVTCPTISAGNCIGLLALLTAKRVTVAGRKRVLKLGSTPYDVARGATATLKVKLVRASRRLADKNGHLRVVARASTAVSGAAAQSSRHLRLALRAWTNPTHPERQQP